MSAEQFISIFRSDVTQKTSTVCISCYLRRVKGSRSDYIRIVLYVIPWWSFSTATSSHIDRFLIGISTWFRPFLRASVLCPELCHVLKQSVIFLFASLRKIHGTKIAHLSRFLSSEDAPFQTVFRIRSFDAAWLWTIYTRTFSTECLNKMQKYRIQGEGILVFTRASCWYRCFWIKSQVLYGDGALLWSLVVVRTL